MRPSSIPYLCFVNRCLCRFRTRPRGKHVTIGYVATYARDYATSVRARLAACCAETRQRVEHAVEQFTYETDYVARATTPPDVVDRSPGIRVVRRLASQSLKGMDLLEAQKTRVRRDAR